MNDTSSYRPSYLEEPQVSFLGRILEDVRSGAILVPRFQRRFEWKSESRLLLFDSIKQGIPIGSLLVWRTTGRSLDVFREIGGVPIAIPEASTSSQYLLDGHQRITTLLSALSSRKAEATVELSDTGISAGDAFYDLRAKAFVIRGKRNVADPNLLPLSILFSSLEILKFQRQIASTDMFHDEIIEEIDRLADVFRNYKIPLIPLVTNDLEAATTAFQRINSSGTDLSFTHMVVALTYSENYDLAEVLADSETKLRLVNWEGLDQKFILATVRALAGIEIARPNVVPTSERVRKEPELVIKAVDAICIAAKFLREECNIPSPEFLPYSFQAVLLAYGFSQNREIKRVVREALRKWLWLTTYTGQFRGAREADIDRAKEDVLAIFGGDFTPVERLQLEERLETATRYDFRSALVKASLIRFAERQFEKSLGKRDEILDFLAQNGAKVAIQLLSARNLKKDLSSLLSNRFLATSNELVSAFKNLDFRVFDSAEICEQHLLSTKAIEKLRREDFSSFIETRSLEILQVENRFIQSIGLEARHES
jgi:uncharacterized protein with ParB-like and HNH nuclease domain